MSRASLSSQDEQPKPDAHAPQAVVSPSHGNLERSDNVARSITEAGQNITRDTKNSTSRSFPSSSVNHLSSEDVFVQNSVQGQTPTAAENGVSPSISTSATLPKPVGQASYSESTADQKLPAMQARDPVSSTIQPTNLPTNLPVNQNATKFGIATPRARLPHDRVGILEDRIKEDPRGDLDAWLNLVGEYRKRGKLDEARNVYERFLAVFPSSVRILEVRRI